MYPAHHMVLLRHKLIQDILIKKKNVTEVAEILSVSRQSVHKWIAKYNYEGLDGLVPKKSGPKSGETHNRTSEEIEQTVEDIAKLHPFDGPIMLKDTLEHEHSIILDQTTIYRILKRRKVRYGLGYHHLKKKKIAYVLGFPGQEVQLDVCFPYGYNRRLVVYSLIDDCSRYIFSRAYTSHTQATSIEFVQQAIRSLPFLIQAVRTDCGREFSAAFTAFLNQNEIDHRKNPPYTPQHNGKIERYHRTFKEREAWFWHFDYSLSTINYRLFLWTSFYNHKRPHTGLGMNRRTPIQKLYQTINQSWLQADLTSVNLMLQQNKI